MGGGVDYCGRGDCGGHGALLREGWTEGAHRQRGGGAKASKTQNEGGKIRGEAKGDEHGQHGGEPPPALALAAVLLSERAS